MHRTPERSLACFVEAPTRFLFFTGKGGVGKTSLACATAIALADRQKQVLLVSTDPASNLDEVLGQQLNGSPTPIPGVGALRALNIDPEAAARAYCEKVVGPYRGQLPETIVRGMEEQLSGACTMEIAAFDEFAVFRAFARIVAAGEDRFVVLDTAPTGHTLLLLDASEAYHREIARKASDLPAEVKELMPRLRDPNFTRVLLVTLPEATPVHEAASLQADLKRAHIEPFAWIINQSMARVQTTDPVLLARGNDEIPYIREVSEQLSRRTAIVSWVPEEPVGPENLRQLFQT
jgi:arsenite-transporting ATPase